MRFFASRSKILFGLMYVLGAIFIVRLFYLQIIQHDYYQTQAIKEHTSKFTIPAQRGLIYAQDAATGTYSPLVLNEPTYTVYADPRYVKDAGKVANVIKQNAGSNVVDNFQTNLNNKNLQYTVLARHISKNQADAINKAGLDGVGMQEQDKRVYPEGQLAAQVLGFVNDEGQGQYGIEQALNSKLQGKDGLLKAITDVHGIPLSVGANNVQDPAQNGQNVVLTIDRNVQNKAEQALAAGLQAAHATKGSALVLDPTNGHVLAMANAPTYNPNDYSNVSDYNVFTNRTISTPYEPGSVMKTLTMATGLNEGVIQPTTTYVNTGSVKVDDATISNVEHINGTLNMMQVLQYSLNTGAVFVLKQLGGGDITPTAKQKLFQYFNGHFFLGQKTGIQLAYEQAGYVVPSNSVDEGNVQYANMSFGQGMTVTMLQMASAFSAAVNGGTYYAPQIISGMLDDNNHFTPSPTATTIRAGNVVSAVTSAKLRQMVEFARGHSAAANGSRPGYTFGGKTGTAQVYDSKTGGYSATQYIGSYVGYVGRDAPQYVIMIRVDDAQPSNNAGTSAAAPIFTDIANWMIDYEQIQPKG